MYLFKVSCKNICFAYLILLHRAISLIEIYDSRGERNCGWWLVDYLQYRTKGRNIFALFMFLMCRPATSRRCIYVFTLKLIFNVFMFLFSSKNPIYTD